MIYCTFKNVSKQLVVYLICDLNKLVNFRDKKVY